MTASPSSGPSGDNLPKPGDRVEVITSSLCRYEGSFEKVNRNRNSFTLTNVRAYGTENRKAKEPIAGSKKRYNVVEFNADDIKSIQTDFQPLEKGTLKNDPAVLGVNNNRHTMAGHRNGPMQQQQFNKALRDAYKAVFRPQKQQQQPFFQPFNRYNNFGNNQNQRQGMMGFRQQNGPAFHNQRQMMPPFHQGGQVNRRMSRGGGQGGRDFQRGGASGMFFRGGPLRPPVYQHSSSGMMMQDQQRGGGSPRRAPWMQGELRRRQSEGVFPQRNPGMRSNSMDDFDFEKASEEFARLKIDDEKRHESGDDQAMKKDKSEDEVTEAPASPSKKNLADVQPAYDKEKSFFDNLQLDQTEGRKPTYSSSHPLSTGARHVRESFEGLKTQGAPRPDSIMSDLVKTFGVDTVNELYSTGYNMQNRRSPFDAIGAGRRMSGQYQQWPKRHAAARPFSKAPGSSPSRGSMGGGNFFRQGSFHQNMGSAGHYQPLYRRGQYSSHGGQLGHLRGDGQSNGGLSYPSFGPMGLYK